MMRNTLRAYAPQNVVDRLKDVDAFKGLAIQPVDAVLARRRAVTPEQAAQDAEDVYTLLDALHHFADNTPAHYVLLKALRQGLTDWSTARAELAGAHRTLAGQVERGDYLPAAGAAARAAAAEAVSNSLADNVDRIAALLADALKG